MLCLCASHRARQRHNQIVFIQTDPRERDSRMTSYDEQKSNDVNRRQNKPGQRKVWAFRPATDICRRRKVESGLSVRKSRLSRTARRCNRRGSRCSKRSSRNRNGLNWQLHNNEKIPKYRVTYSAAVLIGWASWFQTGSSKPTKSVFLNLFSITPPSSKCSAFETPDFK